MTVHTAVELLFRIVQVERRQEPDPDGLVELGERPFVAFPGADVVAGGERVLGVEAHPEPVALLHAVDDVADVLEAVAQVGALPGGDLQRDAHLEARAAPVDGVQGTGDCTQAHSFARPGVGSRMGDEAGNVQSLAALHLVHEGGHGLLPQLPVWRAEVQQVGVVGHHRVDPAGLLGVLEGADVVLAQGLCGPLPRGFGKDLDGLATHAVARVKRIVHPARDGHVGAQEGAVRGFLLACERHEIVVPQTHRESGSGTRFSDHLWSTPLALYIKIGILGDGLARGNPEPNGQG